MGQLNLFVIIRRDLGGWRMTICMEQKRQNTNFCIKMTEFPRFQFKCGLTP